MKTLLSVRNLRVEIPTRRATLVALDDVSFNIDEGEVLGVVGESGAGKSITGSAVIGLIDPPRRVAGGDIGAVFQDPLTSLNPLLTVGRQLAQTITAHLNMPPSEARERALRLLTEVGIPAAKERLDSYPHELSGGMRQRVVLALAFCCEPRLIIADEPTTALDVSVQAQVVDLLRRMCRERGTAVMLITHDMGVIAETADRIGVMYAGRLIEIGPAHAVLKAPAHPYTRGLMGSIPTMMRRTAEFLQIQGSTPRLTAIPPGCAFQPRCVERLARCTHDRPEMTDADGRSVACWLVGEASTKHEKPVPGHA